MLALWIQYWWNDFADSEGGTFDEARDAADRVWRGIFSDEDTGIPREPAD